MQTQINIKYRSTTISDLDTLFQFQLDKESAYMAAFTSKDFDDKLAYINKYSKLLKNPTINNQTIILNDVIVGNVAKFEIDGNAEITYGIDKNYWGQGIATKSLLYLLSIETVRPVFGRVAYDNIASQKVLEKCGFIKIATDKGFANARQAEIEEYIYELR